MPLVLCFSFFFFNDTATTEIYTLSLHDALPISLFHERMQEVTQIAKIFFLRKMKTVRQLGERSNRIDAQFSFCGGKRFWRSEEHTSELQSRLHLVCRLLLEKKKKTIIDFHPRDE